MGDLLRNTDGMEHCNLCCNQSQALLAFLHEELSFAIFCAVGPESPMTPRKRQTAQNSIPACFAKPHLARTCADKAVSDLSTRLPSVLKHTSEDVRSIPVHLCKYHTMWEPRRPGKIGGSCSFTDMGTAGRMGLFLQIVSLQRPWFRRRDRPRNTCANQKGGKGADSGEKLG